MENYDLEKIASAQRGIILCVLIHILTMILAGAGIVVPLISGIIIYAAAIYAVVCVAKLAKALGYGIPLTVVICICLFIPLVSLITMLILNGKATGILKENGIKVGLFGANMKK